MHPRPRAPLRYDFAVYNRQGSLSALLETKRRFGTDQAWAQAWYASSVERREVPPDALVMLVTPDRIYAWRPGASASATPDWSFDASPWLQPYFERLKIPVAEVAPSVFEAIVGLWLRDAADGALLAGHDAGAGSLLDALREGEVVEQVAA